MNRYYLMVMLAVGVLLLAGCESNGVYFEDNIKEEFDVLFDFSMDKHPDNKIHLPYAVGANVKISIYPDDDDETHFNYEAFFESANPDIAQILDDTGEYKSDGSGLSVEIETKAAGKTELIVYKNADRKKTWGKVKIEVEEPDAVYLIPAGVTFLREERKNINLTNPIQIVKDQKTTLLARYYAGEQKLYGNSVIMFENENPDDAGINIEVVQTYNNESRDWLRVEMLDTESHTIDIGTILNPKLSTLEFKGVEIERAETIVFWSDSEESVDDDGEITVWARAQDEDNHPVFGTGFNWTYDEEPGLEYGDLYTYYYDRNEEATLAATMGEISGSIVIHGDAGYIDNSNNIDDVGCSSQNDMNALLLAVGLAGCFAVRRRRSSVY